MSWTSRSFTPPPTTTLPRRIVHVDINSYFATVVQQENPSLQGKPIGIVKSAGRTCIIAASKEAKKLGIKTGCRVKEARLLAPNIILVPAAFSIYLSCTHKLHALFHELCPSSDIFSLDEAFLDLTQDAKLYPDLPAFGRLIQRRISDVLGEWVTCNVGISHNKLLAKMAGEIGPKGSVSQITQDNLDQVLSTVVFADVCGVGMRLEKRLHTLGIHHPYEINLLDDATLHTHFGPFWSKELRKIGLGEETHFFTHQRTTDHMQSVGRTITGYTLCNNEDHIKKTLLNLLEEATYKLRRMNLAGRMVGISLSGDDQYWGKMLRLKYFVRHTNEIFEILYTKLYKNWDRTFPVIKFGVYIGGLLPMDEIPQCWLPAWQKNEKLYETIDRVNNRFGLFTLKPATLTNHHIIRPEVTGFLGDRQFYELDK